MSPAPQPAVSTPRPTSVIAGRAVDGDGRTIALRSPLDGRAIGELHVATPELVDRAVGEAATAAVAWGATPVKDRVQPLFRFKELAERRIDELARIVSAENGKTVAEAEAGLRKGLEVVEFACSMPQVASGELLEVSSGVDCWSRRLPLGVVAGITPFNFPAMVPLWMFPIAIACGNAFILKPSEQVPLTPVRMAELLAEAGLPAGVFNVLQGDRGTVEALLDHRGVAAAAFVGSTPVARAVHQRGTTAGKRVLALGGAKNHLVVVPDADPVITGRNVASSAFGCAGQRCMAASVLIAVGDCGPALDAVIAASRAIRVGTDMGAVISQAAKSRILGHIERALADGGKLLVDGRGANVAGKEGGNWLGPTVIDGLPQDHPCLREEVFGPVLGIVRVRTLDEALAIENASPFGNAASIYTGSGAVASVFERRAKAGMIGINIGVPVPREPFAFGGFDDSRFGVGDVTGRDAIGFWTKTRKVTRKWTASSSANWMS
jgi:malonate-semialdehyde dehydrogenase (acetylating)/methylmalonate-semialdehyde dehydrogenase